MNPERQRHFRNLLVEERQRTADSRTDQSTARTYVGEDVNDSGDRSHSDTDKELAFNLGERERHVLQEIDDALRRIEDGTYGICERCGEPIEEPRLEALPSARYHARCQAEIEATQGAAAMPTL